MGFLFPVSPDHLTALHCIRGSLLAGGDGNTGRLYLLSFLSFFVLFLAQLVLLAHYLSGSWLKENFLNTREIGRKLQFLPGVAVRASTELLGPV